ncbi:MAG: aminotransferase class III-fold pyridoxal phosphate-dependent enzyme, partial [bacterium]|nr:aminotransferase class III-fold pyridoxal phosphate-dependent enzyme [bacterium]
MTVRQLFEDFPTVTELAGFLLRQRPAPATREPEPPPPQPVTTTTPTPPAVPPAPPTRVPANRTVPASAVESVFDAQLQAFNQLVAQQIELLHRRGSSPTAREPATPTTISKPAEAPLQPPVPAIASGREGASPTTLNARQQAHLEALIERYTRRTARSKQLTQESRHALADSRAIVGFRPLIKEMLYPLARGRAAGSRIWDLDGNEYVDITMGMGVHLFGHAPPFLTEVLERQVREGFELGPRSEVAGEVAALLCRQTGMERATFTTSGTEAVMTAIRLARAATGRRKIALFAGSYHGHSDGTLIRSQPVDGELRSFPVAPGVPAAVASDVLVVEYGSERSLEILDDHARELAAVLVEPVQSRRPELQPREFLHQLRRLTSDAGAALVFDEMLTGFRLHPGGAQAWFDVRADIATYGKVVGGGLPIGVVAGRAEYMDGIDGGMWRYGDASYPERETTFFGGTYSQHPLALTAARTVLRHLGEH